MLYNPRYAKKGLHYLIEVYQRLGTDKKLVIGGSSHTDEYE